MAARRHPVQHAQLRLTSGTVSADAAAGTRLLHGVTDKARLNFRIAEYFLSSTLKGQPGSQ
jgi:hypothetical protein